MAPTWYGYQNLIADATGCALVFGGLIAHKATPAILGGVLLLVGSPVVHWAHHNSLGGPSFAVRLLSALIVVVGGASVDEETAANANSRAGAYGLALVGATRFAVITIADAILGFGGRTSERARMAPWFDPQRNAVGMSLDGSL